MNDTIIGALLGGGLVLAGFALAYFVIWAASRL